MNTAYPTNHFLTPEALRLLLLPAPNPTRIVRIPRPAPLPQPNPVDAVDATAHACSHLLDINEHHQNRFCDDDADHAATTALDAAYDDHAYHVVPDITQLVDNNAEYDRAHRTDPAAQWLRARGF